MENKYKEIFESITLPRQFRPAIHLAHYDIDHYASELLSSIFGRDIRAEGERSDYYDWSIRVLDGSITEDELEKLYDIVGANGYDRTSQSYNTDDDDSASGLCQGISQKLFSQIMPFEVCISLSDEEGIWLFGSESEPVASKPTPQCIENAEANGKSCVCGNTRFTASQLCYHDVIVDSDNNFIDNIGIFQSESPYGSYSCTKCGAEYEELESLEENIGVYTSQQDEPAYYASYHVSAENPKQVCG
jgi:hypothetical protein